MYSGLELSLFQFSYTFTIERTQQTTGEAFWPDSGNRTGPARLLAFKTVDVPLRTSAQK